ncbi:flagellar hook-basal body protein [Bacillus alkalicellulosilyticus]|uniref:flagellar hook-basal body protein n=1 Tax=Alkalihalobacterium alkalicellulosilyticum TaxID=1912214 RepID=UPI00099608B0|nr:flagellar hook-basal body protein [Bacillus alkalicellulosilyticus]
MLRGIYSSAAAMVAQQQRQEMLTNNIANANTPGYKADQASLRAFPNMLIKAMNTSNFPPHSQNVGELSTGVYLQDRMPNFRQGDINETGNSTDIALLQGVVPGNGALFFAVQNDQGDVRYTRNGNFAVDANGHLVTTEGHYILDTTGNRMQVGSENFVVDRNGQVVTEFGAPVGQIGIAFAEDPLQLVKEGNGLHRLNDGQLPTAIGNPNINYQLQQGFIERSNVDATQTMTEMMAAFRNFEANQRILQAYDQSLSKAVNEVGRIG